MRFPVFARRSNPSIDPPILRKSESYITDQVKSGRADWVDPLDPTKGIICRELLYFGFRPIAPEPETTSGPNVERGLRFEDPNPARNWRTLLGLWERGRPKPIFPDTPITDQELDDFYARNPSTRAAAVLPTQPSAPRFLAWI